MLACMLCSYFVGALPILCVTCLYVCDVLCLRSHSCVVVMRLYLCYIMFVCGALPVLLCVCMCAMFLFAEPLLF